MLVFTRPMAPSVAVFVFCRYKGFCVLSLEADVEASRSAVACGGSSVLFDGVGHLDGLRGDLWRSLRSKRLTLSMRGSR